MLSKLLGGSLVDTVGKVIDSVHTSEEEKLAAKAKLKELENEINAKQIEVNLADAKSTATDIQVYCNVLGDPSLDLARPWPYFSNLSLNLLSCSF